MNQLYSTLFGQKLSKQFLLKDAIKLLDEMNLINTGELAELAISKKSQVERCSKNYPKIDLVSGVQIKHGLTNPETKGNDGRMRAWISIKGQTSIILAVITERLTGKQYFFRLPRKAYQHCQANTIGIPFDQDGSPCLRNKWWRYQVSSFETLCEMAK